MLGGGPDEKVGGAPKNSGLKGASEKKKDFEGGYLKIKS